MLVSMGQAGNKASGELCDGLVTGLIHHHCVINPAFGADKPMVAMESRQFHRVCKSDCIIGRIEVQCVYDTFWPRLTSGRYKSPCRAVM